MGEGENIRELADAVYRDKVKRAREMAPEDRLWEGPRLFAGVCERMKDGIRARHPDADEGRVHELLLEQLETLERIRRV